jgi:carbon-monoxide dehydrogenase medium subunit
MVFFAICDRPVLAVAATKLVHAILTPGLISEAVADLDHELDPLDDQQASSSMRRHLAKILFRRCAETLSAMGPDGGAG